MLLVSTLFSLVCAFSLTVSAAKNCTHDPVTYLSQPIAYLAEHPILTHDIDVLCRDIRKFTRLLSVNATNIVATHPNLDLNATEIEIFLANVTAELKVLESNTTLVRLCERAKEVEDGCWPLVYQTWKLNKPECRPAPLQNETEAAGKNETLVKLCEVFVAGCNNNVTVTDAALIAADVNSSSSSPSTTSAASASTTATTTATTTNKSMGSQVEALHHFVLISIFVLLSGALMLS